MIKFNDMSKSIRVIITAGAVATAMVAVVVPTVWALDTRYITIGSFEQALDKRDIRDLKRDIRKLEYLKDGGQASERQLWELDDLSQELDELTQ
jgi:hypothetical protein